jgi:hypothetical protein
VRIGDFISFGLQGKASLRRRIVPFFDSYGIPLARVLTDPGTEYCGNPEHHEYELYLAVENPHQSALSTSQGVAADSQMNRLPTRR